jgi:hypothetical protein
VLASSAAGVVSSAMGKSMVFTAVFLAAGLAANQASAGIFSRKMSEEKGKALCGTQWNGSGCVGHCQGSLCQNVYCKNGKCAVTKYKMRGDRVPVGGTWW